MLRWAGILGHSCFVESHPQAREAEEAKEKAKATFPVIPRSVEQLAPLFNFQTQEPGVFFLSSWIISNVLQAEAEALMRHREEELAACGC